jgi:protein TonB
MSDVRRDALFEDLLTRPRHSGGWFGVRESLAAHALLITAALVLPVLWSSDLPPAKGIRGILYLDPPAAAAAPLPKGRPDGRPKPAAASVTPEPHPREPVMTEPPVVQEAPLQPEDGVPEAETLGSETGSANGVADGMDGGQDGGEVGGSLFGVVGGCRTCSGEGPVRDYDQPPRLVQSFNPEYPQDAFVKKVEGTVLLEIVIDDRGQVTAVRILHSIAALDAAAVAAVKKWRFEPAVKKGRRVATFAQVPVSFRIF